jgi:hypothetical protein
MHSACAAHGHASAARVHGAGVAHERGPRPRGCSPARPRPASKARGAARARAMHTAAARHGCLTAAPSLMHGRWPGKCGGAHRRVDSGATRRRRRRRRVARRAWTSAARRLGEDRWRATGTGERVSADGDARNAGARHTHRRGGVDGGVDGSDATATASDRASMRLRTTAVETARRSGVVRQLRQRCGRRAWACVRTAAVRTALSVRLLSRPARSDTAAHSSQSGLGVARHCR